MRFLILFTAIPLAAQISSPQLGYISHRGELRRIEGLTHTSRLSDPIPGLPACSRLDTSSRYALCTTTDGTAQRIDLQTLTARGSVPAYERIVWSPNGSFAALDSQVHDFTTAKSTTSVEGQILAVSDSGAALVRDTQGSLHLRGEIVAGPEVTAASFDDQALLVAEGSSIRRIDPGRSAQQFPLAFEPTLLASDSGAFYAANSRAIARIDRATGEITVYQAPAEDIAITKLERLNGGSLLIASPGENQPGWLFRDGRFSFIPGIAVNEEGNQ